MEYGDKLLVKFNLTFLIDLDLVIHIFLYKIIENIFIICQILNIIDRIVINLLKIGLLV